MLPRRGKWRHARFYILDIVNTIKTESDLTPPNEALDRSRRQALARFWSMAVAQRLSSDDTSQVNRLSALPYDNKKVWVKSLVMDCPLGKPLASCALTDLRKLNVGERASLVDRMAEVQLEEIIEIHRRCRAKREAL